MKNDIKTLFSLVKRGIKIFLTDKATVFFSLLAPLIILMLYVLFLGDIQMDSLEGYMNGMPVEKSVLRGVVDSWMLSGVFAVSAITVSFSAMHLNIADRETGVYSDMLVSPVKRGILSFSYIIYNFVVTVLILAVILVIAFIYLAACGSWFLTAADVFSIIGCLILSAFSASVISTIFAMFIKTQSAHGAIVGILSAAIGFLIGAYMPISMFPKFIQYLILFIPGTYSAAILRELFMNGAIAEIAKISPYAADGIREGFSVELNMFGNFIETGYYWLIFAGAIILTIVLCAVLVIVKNSAKRDVKLFAKTPKSKSAE